MLSASLPQWQTGFGGEVFVGEIAGEPLGVRSGGDHRGVVSGEWARREVNGNACLRSLALERRAKFAVSSHTTRDEKGGDIVGLRRGQGFADKVLDHGALERCNQ